MLMWSSEEDEKKKKEKNNTEGGKKRDASLTEKETDKIVKDEDEKKAPGFRTSWTFFAFIDMDHIICLMRKTFNVKLVSRFFFGFYFVTSPNPSFSPPPS